MVRGLLRYFRFNNMTIYLRHFKNSLIYKHGERKKLDIFMDRTNVTEVEDILSDGFSCLPIEALDELHKIATRYMSNENYGHTLQATALVNEAYLSLCSADIKVNDKMHFFALAATHMRRILVDHARAKSAQKRGANALVVNAQEHALVDPGNMTSIVLLDEVLTQLAKLDERAANMYEMRLFAGLQNTELAEVFNISVATVEREIRVAKAWVQLHFNEQGDSNESKMETGKISFFQNQRNARARSLRIPECSNPI